MHSVLHNSKYYFLFNIVEINHWHKTVTIHGPRPVLHIRFSQSDALVMLNLKGNIKCTTIQKHLELNFKERKHFIIPLICKKKRFPISFPSRRDGVTLYTFFRTHKYDQNCTTFYVSAHILCSYPIHFFPQCYEFFCSHIH